MKKIIYQAFVTIKAFRLYSIINIMGLALSLSCVMLLSMYIFQETTVDSFHTKSDTIYGVANKNNLVNKGQFSLSDFYRHLQLFNQNGDIFDIDNQPEVKSAVRVICISDEIELDDARLFNATILNVDTSFYSVFDFPLLVGDKSNVLKNPRSVVVKKSFANKAFGDKDPIGQKIIFSGEEFTISGIAGESEGKSTLDYDLLVPMSMYGEDFSAGRLGAVFFVIESEQQAKNLAKKASSLYFVDGGTDGTSSIKEPIQFDFIPLRDLYLKEDIVKMSDMKSGSIANIRILSLVGVVLLVIGIFNYANITSLITNKRGKEIAVRKILGVEKGNMYTLFFLENFLQVLTATLLAIILIEYMRPLALNHFEMDVRRIFGFDMTLFAVIVIVLPFIIAIFPYIKYRYSVPVNAIKQLGVLTGRPITRSIFTTLQYIMTIVLIVISLFFIKQLNVMLDADMGIKTENILVAKPAIKIKDYGMHLSRAAYDEIIEKQNKDEQYIVNRLNNSSLIESWTMSDRIVGEEPDDWCKFSYREGFKQMKQYSMTAAQNTLFGLQLVEGRLFRAGEEFSDNKVILTESSKRALGIENITNAVIQSDTPLWYRLEDETMNRISNTSYEVVGVVKDFFPTNRSKVTEPFLLIANRESCFNNLIVKYRDGKEQEVLTELKDIYAQSSGAEFEYTTMESTIQEIYKNDRRVSFTYSICAIVAILISTLGLFGLSLFDVQHRYREIALRKVNGATKWQIINLLFTKYYKLLLIAFVIACPLSLFAITRYLEDFALKAPISGWIFLLAALITGVISFCTLFWQISVAANENPAKAMKRE